MSTCGELLDPFRDMLRLAGKTGCEFHVVTEGAGVLVLHELLRAQAGRQEANLDHITTLSLVHPAIDLLRASRYVVPLVQRLNAKDTGAPAYSPRARIYRASAALEARTCFDTYGGSLLGLVARAFEDRHQIGDEPLRDAARNARPPTHPDNPPRRFLGMADAQSEKAQPDDLAFCTLTAVKDRRYATGKVPHNVLRDDPLIHEEIFSTIAARRAPGTTRKGTTSIPR